jgi:hypothetical protein
MIYYVSKKGSNLNPGTKEAPFSSINHAAQIAVAGDTVRVFGGTYREWVDPRNSGEENAPIVYEAVNGERPVIKGSEILTDWEHVEGTVWKKSLPNHMFGDWNPYAQRVYGDWFAGPKLYDAHYGDVYINGRSMYEASSIEDLYTAELRYSGFQKSPPPIIEPIPDPAWTKYRWYAQVTEDETTILCNFHALDPNRETIEINLRKCCFYPTRTGRNYITLRGFEIAHAACPFTPPTSDQIGMVGANWSKGWIIENNDIHDAKCSGISIGKEASTGNNDACMNRKKHAHYYQTEAVFLGLQKGWSRENIGSHIIRNNVIHDCGQNGIVGHMGCVFSRIEHNHIYHIAVKHEFYGAEIAAIKLHAAIDVVIENNNVHDCTRGLWLDWQAQGTRVTKNLFYNNSRSDVMVEVSHGPCLIDHNVFLSVNTFENASQGTAFVHNLIGGNVWQTDVLDRQTPYHFPHSTLVKGITKVLGGDDRVLNNLILGMHPSSNTDFRAWCADYDRQVLPEIHYERMKKELDPNPIQPVWIDGNAYAGFASAFREEAHFIRVDGMQVSLKVTEGQWSLLLDVPQSLFSADCQEVTTPRLGAPIFSEASYENPDGTPIDFSVDILGAHRGDRVLPGPFASLFAGACEIRLWRATL